MTVTLGVDPGGAHTGLVLRGTGDRLLAHATVGGGGIETIVAIDNLGWLDLYQVDLVAVEQVVAPKAYIDGEYRLINPETVIDTAVAAGEIVGWAIASRLPHVWVPPAKNGQLPIFAYPRELQPTKGKGAGRDNQRHARSAWDVAMTGELLARAQRPYMPDATRPAVAAADPVHQPPTRSTTNAKGNPTDGCRIHDQRKTRPN